MASSSLSSSSSPGKKRTEREEEQPKLDSKRTRIAYRALSNKLELNSGADEERLNEYLRLANTLAKGIGRDTRNAALDSQTVCRITDMAARRAGQISLSQMEFSNADLVSRFCAIKATGSNSSAQGSLPDWRYLGEISAQVFHFVPSLQFMLGPIHCEIKARAPRKAHVQQKIAPVTTTTQLGKEAEIASAIETSKVVETVHTLHQDTGDVNFWKFVIDPQSFTQTVENVFHVAFLIQLGKAGTSLDRNGEILLKVRGSSEEGEPAASHPNQCIIKLDQHLWKLLRQKFTEAVIPHRDYADLHKMDEKMAARRASLQQNGRKSKQ
ncbi:MAG: non-structural maintenance of chromosomes element 4 [archaeon]|nr:non-structural maintenance of chromosomes element 4 [archaeon]